MVEFLNELCNYEYIYIYGAGRYGKTLAAYLLEIGMLKKVSSFLVTAKDKEEKIFGKSVSELKSLCFEIKKDELIVVAVSESKQKDILEHLQNNGISNVVKMTDDIYKVLRNRYEDPGKDNRSLINNCVNDILYGQNLDRAASKSEWLKKKDFSTGSAAVNNQYMYMLYKILDSGRFSSFLDIGMGQTSKLMQQYAEHNTGVRHVIIEGDRDWADYFSDINGKGASEIEIFEYEMKKECDIEVRVFAGFKDRMKGRKFDYISIDAPFGADMTKYSRIDLLELLPDCLMDSWIIMLDDIQRRGERRTLDQIKKILIKNGIRFMEKRYAGTEKEFAILASFDNRFFCTV